MDKRKKGEIYSYDSPDGTEAINLRGISSSAQTFIEDGYTVNITMDLMKLDLAGNLINGTKKEIKFILPNK